MSMARWLAWAEACGKPPTFPTSSSLLIWRASFTVLPLTNSVMAEPQAIAGTQPLARKRISAMRFASNFVVSKLFSNLRLSSRMSPQAGFSRRAVESGASTSPAFRGF